ncbi:Geranylgeranyl reductase [Hibiscus syriacus]|uniref:Geranylgeranyl reductase n=1 Tax=Hibiscus syriacus TaxID=106335 RepID=A0A6A2ZM23_HIBSY|nr:Geranylgeranyl reductase [Hibiscus syriacus]
MAVVKCAIELGIADIIENHGSPMPLSQLTTTLRCEPSRLNRIMRFLVHYGVFKQEPIGQHHGLLIDATVSSTRVLESGDISPFESANGDDIWSYAEANSGHSELINEAMACSARVTVPAIIEGCPEVFDGVKSLVDVGGGNGTTLSLLVKAFPWIRGITSISSCCCRCTEIRRHREYRRQHVHVRPNADAAFFMVSHFFLD